MMLFLDIFALMFAGRFEGCAKTDAIRWFMPEMICGVCAKEG